MEEKEFKVTTNITKDIVMKLSIENFKQSAIIYMALVVIFAGAGIGTWLFTGNIAQGLIIMVLGGLFPVVFSVFYFVNANRGATNSPDVKNKTVQNFVIDKEKIVATQRSEVSELGEMTYEYKSLLKVRESKDYVFLYINKFSALVLEKANIEGGETSELTQLIRTQVANAKS